MLKLKKKCELCRIKISPGTEFQENVKVPEFKGLQTKHFCKESHATFYKENICGTPRRNFCPTCPLP
jgi:hypothetical protein